MGKLLETWGCRCEGTRHAALGGAASICACVTTSASPPIVLVHSCSRAVSKMEPSTITFCGSAGGATRTAGTPLRGCPTGGGGRLSRGAVT